MTLDLRSRAVPPADDPGRLVERFHRILVESILQRAPAYLRGSFTVAEIYQSLVPYRSHRDRLGLSTNRGYEDVLLRLLAGEGELLVLQSSPARQRIQEELESQSPNTGIYREFAAAEVQLNPSRLPPDLEASSARDAPAAKVVTSAVATESERSAGEPATGPAAAGQGTDAVAGSTPAADACPECDRSLPHRDHLKFCPHCGTNTQEAPCPSCGEVLDRRWQFCIACGVQVLA